MPTCPQPLTIILAATEELIPFQDAILDNTVEPTHMKKVTDAHEAPMSILSMIKPLENKPPLQDPPPLPVHRTCDCYPNLPL